jgi:hypothetical protein
MESAAARSLCVQLTALQQTYSFAKTAIHVNAFMSSSLVAEHNPCHQTSQNLICSPTKLSVD